MATKPTARMQIILPYELKADLERFAESQGVSLNEASRVLMRRGLEASGRPVSVLDLAEELTNRLRERERR